MSYFRFLVVFLRWVLTLIVRFKAKGNHILLNNEYICWMCRYKWMDKIRYTPPSIFTNTRYKISYICWWEAKECRSIRNIQYIQSSASHQPIFENLRLRNFIWSNQTKSLGKSMRWAPLKYHLTPDKSVLVSIAVFIRSQTIYRVNNAPAKKLRSIYKYEILTWKFHGAYLFPCFYDSLML